MVLFIVYIPQNTNIVLGRNKCGLYELHGYVNLKGFDNLFATTPEPLIKYLSELIAKAILDEEDL